MKTRKYIRTTLIVLIWLVIWQILAVIVNNSILLSGPVDTVKALIDLGTQPSFYLSVGATAGKVLIGHGYRFISYRFPDLLQEHP